MNLLTEEQKANKSVITFGAGRPDEQGDFGIEHDLRAGGIDWLVWAEVDEDLEPQPKRRRKAAVVEDEPLRLKRLLPADALRIRGRHNALNALAALAYDAVYAMAAKIASIPRITKVIIVSDLAYCNEKYNRLIPEINERHAVRMTTFFISEGEIFPVWTALKATFLFLLSTPFIESPKSFAKFDRIWRSKVVSMARPAVKKENFPAA